MVLLSMGVSCCVAVDVLAMSLCGEGVGEGKGGEGGEDEGEAVGRGTLLVEEWREGRKEVVLLKEVVC